MKVIIQATGKIQEVSDGYARNYLLPRKLAVPATKSAVAANEAQQATMQVQADEVRKINLATVERLRAKTLTLSVKANDTGRLFAAASVEDIARLAEQQAKHIVPVTSITCPPIKQTGDYTVTVALMDLPPVQFTLKVVAQ